MGEMVLNGEECKQKGVACADITLSINSKSQLTAKLTDRNTKATVQIDIIRPKQFKEEAITMMKDELHTMEMQNKETTHGDSHG